MNGPIEIVGSKTERQSIAELFENRFRILLLGFIGDHAVCWGDNELAIRAFGVDEFLVLQRRKHCFERIDLDIDLCPKFEYGHTLVGPFDESIENRDLGFFTVPKLPLRSHDCMYYRPAINMSLSRGAFTDEG